MNGINLVADTNFLISAHEGKPQTEPFLDSTFIVSVISEIELLGWHKISKNDKQVLEALLDDCIILELTSEIKNLAIEIRQNIQVKTPDAIIAATAKFLKLPLITSDREFTKLKDIEIILL